MKLSPLSSLCVSLTLFVCSCSCCSTPDRGDSSLEKMKRLAKSAMEERESKRDGEVGKIERKQVSLLRQKLNEYQSAGERGQIKIRDRLGKELSDLLSAMIPALVPCSGEWAASTVGRMVELFALDERDVELQYERVKARIRERLRPLSPQGGFPSLYPPVPSKENAAILLKEAWEMKKMIAARPDSINPYEIDPYGDPQEQNQLAQRFLDEYGPVILVLREAFSRPRFRDLSEWAPDWKNGFFEGLPRRMNDGRFLLQCATANTILGRNRSAHEMCNWLLIFTKWMGEIPVLEARDLLFLLTDFARSALEDLFKQSHPSPEEISTYLLLLETSDPRVSLQRAIQGAAWRHVQRLESGLSFKTLDVDVNKPIESWEYTVEAIPRFRSRALLVLLLELFAEETVEIWLKIQELSRNSIREMLASLSGDTQGNMVSFFRSTGFAQANVNLMITALRCLQFKAGENRLPTNLAEVEKVLAVTLPMDPFTGKSLHYDMGRIWSVGPDGKSDSDREDDPDDEVFDLGGG